ncbi:MAG: rhomboid family intramembrane serine protease [Mycobacteriales bacterium]
MVIPIHDDNPTRRVPIVTYVLIALNILVFFQEPIARADVAGGETAVVQQCRQLAYFRHWSAIPKELTTNQQLPLAPGGPAGPDSCEAVRPDYQKTPLISVFTSMFLHGGLLHLLGNMLFLFVFGNNVEDRLGRVRFALFYVVCGYVAAYAFAFAFPQSENVLVGASGAIAGVLGAYLVFFPKARVTSLVPFLLFYPARLPAWVVLGFWFVLQWVYSRGAALTEGSGVAYLAHVAGFLAGVVFAVVLRRKESPPVPANRWA